ncbi:MFS transporter [Phaeovulum vinaykumarii]|uniref:Sugar phosphate permease n=1 Tax=Phaeovulum vinaykumarii TaxID=407234 RepID=A0A1N7KBX7_9RHOB|nr:MFS transporter [Phaeovulum vinaykumarii]SIS58934.1 Sugar phosphate permease [Phaeovulum vinaykumarii]SOB93965.1 sugar phosphate permease [Phaeovulum vinaykumarii]
MRAGLVFLVLGYVLSQFYRSFLAVLSPTLKAEIGADAGDLATSLGLWYIAFAAMQIPVGAALDRIGPRRVVSLLLALGGGGGAILFALAQGPWAIHAAMIAIGIGCSPVLMGSYFIIARTYPLAAFGALAGAVIGIGSLGNIAGATPLVWVIEALGWRPTLWALAAVTLAVAAAVAVFTRDPEVVAHKDGEAAGLGDLLRLPGMWAILALVFVNYTAAAGIRGVWAGPYLAQVHGADPVTIGNVTLIMGLAMVAGNFAYGAGEKVLGSVRRVNILGNGLLVASLAALWLMPGAGLASVTLLLAAVGFFGSSYPALMAHGRAFLPPHLVGRGVTLLNLFSIVGVGLAQFGSRPVFAQASEAGDPAAAFSALFLFFLAPLALGLVLYLFSRTPDPA